MNKKFVKGLAAIALSVFMTVPVYASYYYEGDIYEGNVDPNSAVGAVYMAQTDGLTTSSFTIIKQEDGNYHLFINATSQHNPYVQTFSGTGELWSSTGMSETILKFTSDGYLWDTAGDYVYVVFNNNVDFPALHGYLYASSGGVTFLYDCDYYEYSNSCPENNLRVENCQQSITLRSEPSTSAAEICQIPLSSGIQYIDNSKDGFFKVSYERKVGYVLAKYTVPVFQ